MPSGLKCHQTQGDDHLITFSCHHRLSYLANNRARITFLTILDQLRQRYAFYLFGYVLMPEHVHPLLNEPRHHASLASTLNVLKTETSKRLKGDRP